MLAKYIFICFINIMNVQINKKYTYPTFQAGLTSQMKREIAETVPKKVEKELKRLNIPSDFRDNKFLAWASIRCVELINAFNHMYNLNLGLPKGIFVEDFELIESPDKYAMGCCNLLPSKIYKNSDKVVSEKTIFFNVSEKYGINDLWKNIDTQADYMFHYGLSATDFYLEPVLHEFDHVIHLDNMLKFLSDKKFVKTIFDIIEKHKFPSFIKNLTLFGDICMRAQSDPLEAVAYDLSRRKITSIDKDTLFPKVNFINRSPYEDKSFMQRILDREPNKLNKLLSRYWRGKID